MRQLICSEKNKTILFAVLAMFLFFLAYYPAIQILMKKWSTSEEYGHAFLTLPIIFYMLWKERKRLSCGKDYSSEFWFLFVIATTGCYLFSMLTQVPTIIFLSLFLIIVEIIVYLFGIQSVKILFTPLVLMLVLIPVPEQVYIQITFPLQLKVSQLSEVIVRMFGVPLLREGNVMKIPGKIFEVVEACSGLRSIITLLTLSLILGYFMLERKLSKMILMLTSIPAAIFVNVVRVNAMILLFYFFKIDLTEGLFHTLSGLVVFIVAVFSLLVISKVLEFWETK